MNKHALYERVHIRMQKYYRHHIISAKFKYDITNNCTASVGGRPLLAPSYPQAPVTPAPVAPQPTYSQPSYTQPGGYQQPAYAAGYGAEQKSKVVAGILGILLGTLGIHNFYLGKTKIALIQLLVSVLSFGFLAWAIGIWGLVEGILILVGSENYRNDGKGIPLKD